MNIDRPDFLKHYSPVSPTKMGGSIKPHYNYDMYKNEYSSRVFATSLNSAIQMYFFFHCASGYYFVDNDRVIVILKSANELDSVFKHEVYLYHVDSTDFEPVVSNGDFCGEWINYNEVSIDNIEIEKISFEDIIVDNKFGQGLTIFCANDRDHYKNIRVMIDNLDYDFKELYLLENSMEYDGVKQLRLVKK